MAVDLAQEQLQQSLTKSLGSNASSSGLSTPLVFTSASGSSTSSGATTPHQPSKEFKEVLLDGHPTRSVAQFREATPPSTSAAGTSGPLLAAQVDASVDPSQAPLPSDAD